MMFDQASGLLAVTSIQTGTCVFAWGVKASDEVARLRLLQAEHLKREKQQKHYENLRWQLAKLERKLHEIDRIERKMKEKGPGALDPAEEQKRTRRAQIL